MVVLFLAHSQLIIYVPISCSTKTFVSSVFIIQAEGDTGCWNRMGNALTVNNNAWR